MHWGIFLPHCLRSSRRTTDGLKVRVGVVDNISRDRSVEIAKEFGYLVETIVVGSFDKDFVKICAERNQHGVPLESITISVLEAILPEKPELPTTTHDTPLNF